MTWEVVDTEYRLPKVLAHPRFRGVTIWLSPRLVPRMHLAQGAGERRAPSHDFMSDQESGLLRAKRGPPKGTPEEPVMNRVRTALIGCGKVGQIQAEALSTLPESDFVAVCDSDPARAQAFATRYRSRPYTAVPTMIKECEVGSVFICTPHPLHARPAIEAARAGAHVLVEKPLAASLEDCDAMIAAARRNEVKLGVISQRRWYEPVRRMKQAIDAGKIGRPVLGGFTMYSWRDQAYYQSDPWRGKWDTEGGGVLINQSPHMLDLLIWLMDDQVTEVCGYWANLNHPYVEVEDSAVAILRFARGGLGSIVTSLSQKPGIHTKVHIHGSNGSSVGVETDRGATFIAGMSDDRRAATQ